MKFLARPYALARPILAVLCLLALSAGASAALITFDVLPECSFASPCLAYSEGGYTFTLSGAEAPSGWHWGDGTGIDGTMNWHGTCGGFNACLTLTLTQDDGGLFDLLTLDIDTYNRIEDTLYPSTLAISAPTYEEQFFHTSVDDYGLNFLSVSQIVFRHPIGTGVGIDNLLVQPAVQVPEPSTLALLGIGLFGMGFAKCKKRA